MALRSLSDEQYNKLHFWPRSKSVEPVGGYRPHPSEPIRTRLGMFIVRDDSYKKDMEPIVQPSQYSINDVAFALPCGRLLWGNAVLLREASIAFARQIDSSPTVTYTEAPLTTPKIEPRVKDLSIAPLDSDDEEDAPGIQENSRSRDRTITRITLKDASYKTYEALLTYLGGGIISFSRITSAKALSMEEEQALADFDRQAGTSHQMSQVSPKSMLLLAQKYGLQALSEQCISSILKQVSKSNAQDELFTIQTLRYPIYRRRLIRHIRKHWRKLVPFPEETWETISHWAGLPRPELIERLNFFRQSVIPHMSVTESDDDVRSGSESGNESEYGDVDMDEGGDEDLTWDTDEDEGPPREPDADADAETALLVIEDGHTEPRHGDESLTGAGQTPADDQAPDLDSEVAESAAPNADQAVKREASETSTSPWTKRLRRSGRLSNST